VLARLYDWLDAFRGEFFSARGQELSAHVAAFLSHFEALGWIERGTGALRATELGAPHLAFFAEQMRAVLESYYVAVSAVAQQGEPLARRALEKRSPSSTSARRCSARSSCPRRTTRSRSATRSTC
jgi:glycerol-3-phosphate O-acyltransferase